MRKFFTYKNSIIQSILLLAGLALLLVPSVLAAQWMGKITVDVPFPFFVDDQKLAAGEYYFTTAEGEPEVLKIRRADGAAELLAVTTSYEGEAIEAGGPEANPKLVFEQHDRRYYLAQVQVPLRSTAWNVELPEEVEAEVDAGRSMKASVDGAESR